jgi:hypothetical protein
MLSNIKDPSSLLFLPFPHFSIILPLYLALIAAPLLEYMPVFGHTWTHIAFEEGFSISSDAPFQLYGLAETSRFHMVLNCEATEMNDCSHWRCSTFWRR